MPGSARRTDLEVLGKEQVFTALFFGLALCAVPVSIAVAESLLGLSLLSCLIALVQRRATLRPPRVFWFWLAWAFLEVLSCLHSPSIKSGWGEIRHLLLIAALFLLAPSLRRDSDRITVWCGIALTSTLGSISLIVHFVRELLFYRGPLQSVVYLRSGGLLHNWMVYGTVEIIALSGLLELWHYFPEKRRWLFPVAAINAIAIALSLTRMLWICGVVLLVLHLLWHRSRGLWAIPVVAALVYFAGPSAIRARIADSIDPAYYSNAERVQMLRVGWKMIRENPLFGVGPGRVDGLYTKYLTPADPIPAYHGHLHNNVVQLAAEFGLPVTAAALLFVIVLFHDLLARLRVASDRNQRFLCRTSLLALTGFLLSGLFDYTYGHSLGLILLGFAVLSPLTMSASSAGPMPATPERFRQARQSLAPALR